MKIRHYTLIFTVMLIFTTFAQNSFDLKSVFGFDFKSDLKKVLAYYKENNIKYEIVNSADGGKLYEVSDTIKIDKEIFTSYKFAVKKGQVESIYIQYPAGIYNYMDDLAKKKANSRNVLESGNEYLKFDNCHIIWSEDYVAFINKKFY